MSAPTYTFGGFPTPATSSSPRGSGHKQLGRRGSSGSSSNNHFYGFQDDDPTDGGASLTYSAASSVTGESTDSSFADIMRVLDIQDNTELAALMKKEGVSSALELKEKKGLHGNSGVSVASSLNYSTDGESHLEGTKLLQAITGQPSAGFGFDGGSGFARDEEEQAEMDDANLLFAPAAPVENLKRRKEKKRQQKTETPVKSKRNSSDDDDDDDWDSSSPESYKSTPRRAPDTSSPPYSRSSSKKGANKDEDNNMIEDDEDICYTKWWMSCFGVDSLKSMIPTRRSR